jgi:type I restriction enzyme S subunit
MAKGERIALGEVAEIDRQIVDPSATDSSEICLSLEDLDAATGAVRIPPQRELAKSAKFRFSPAHILYGKLRPYLGKVVRPEISGICSTDILPILPGDRLDRGFLFHCLRTSEFTAWATQAAVGANLPRLSPSLLSTFAIPLPPLPLQRRIAEVLDKAEALRAKRRAALAQLDSLTQSLFLDLFGDPATNPKGFQIKQLSDVAKVGSGAGFPMDYQGITDAEFPFYKVSDMNALGNENSMHSAKNTISADVRRLLRAEAFPPGSVIFPKIGAAIATNKKRLLAQASCIDNNVMAVSPGEEIASIYLFSLFLFKDISDFAQKGNPPSMRKSDVERWEIPVPPLDLQREFARRVAAVQKLKTAQRAALAEFDALFASLQHRAFRGEL